MEANETTSVRYPAPCFPASPWSFLMSPMRLEWQSAAIEHIATLTPRVRSYALRLSHPFAFIPGQHVDVRLTAPDGYQAQRSYSIASAPQRTDVIELAIEHLEDGEVSGYFHDVAAVGDEIELRGPIGGYFNWSGDESGPVLLLAGGSGIVPFVSMARHRAARKIAVPMHLFVSARTFDDVLYREELRSFHERGEGFVLTVASTREEHPSADFSGRIDRLLAEALLQRWQHRPQRTYICGADAFVEAAAQASIVAGIDAASIRTERYGG